MKFPSYPGFAGYPDYPRHLGFSKVVVFLATILVPSISMAQSGLFLSDHEILVAQYWNSTSQKVSTLVGKTRISLTPKWDLGIKGLGEWIRIESMQQAASAHVSHENMDHGDHDPGGASMDVDAVSGASIVGHGHHGSGEGRGEATVTLNRDLSQNNPAGCTASLRYSGESDYHSSMATLGGNLELFQRNTALSGYLGTGLDFSDPSEPPPGSLDTWPAISTRVAAGLQVGQILSSRLQGGISYALSVLSGALENPYRRARILTTLFPEQLPDQRIRHVGGIDVAYYLGLGIAAFHREGMYMDSWGVQAWIPESAVQIELGKKWLLRSRYKYYYQLPADFYRTSYANLSDWYSGDIRLGHLESDEFSIGAEYSLGNGPNASTLTLSGLHSSQTYLAGGNKIKSYIISLGWKSQ
jgi:hypothetical protein